MSPKELTLSQSLEDYLEAILTLERTHKVARVKQIADLLEVRMPSVTNALKHLREKELVHYEKNSYISLTNDGRRIARRVTMRHATIRTFLQDVLHFTPEDAEETACRIEHVIDGEFIDRLELLNEFFEKNITGTDRCEEWLSYISQKSGKSKQPAKDMEI